MIKRDFLKNETGNKKYITVKRGARLFLYRIHLRRKRMCEAHSSARCIVPRRFGPTNDDAQSRPGPWHTSTRIVINGLYSTTTRFSRVLVGRSQKLSRLRKLLEEGCWITLSLSLSFSLSLPFSLSLSSSRAL